MLSNKILLSQQFIQKKLPHAILITGSQGVGKIALAEWLSSLLLCQSPKQVNYSEQTDINALSFPLSESYYLDACGHCKHCALKQSHSYPDHLVLRSEGSSIGVDDVRHANNFLEKKSHIGNYKTLLVASAETMTIAASNALLKTLEEPTDNSVIMLLTHDDNVLLPTIISRCRLIHIKPTVGEKLLSKTRYSIEGENSDYVNLTHFPELSDEALNLAYKKFKGYYLSVLHSGQQEPLLLVELLNNPHALRWLEKITCNMQRDILINGQTPLLGNSTISSQIINDIYKLIINSSKSIKLYPQGNKAFILEELLMSINEAITP